MRLKCREGIQGPGGMTTQVHAFRFASYASDNGMLQVSHVIAEEIALVRATNAVQH
ncbi:hypothetical protein GJ744_004457 [Endocarpon pusillum]|uniref:Uncharacterized protein n=1 Tax=Endocarpon pusillum TaxID=364733 RepID=A0A8H7AWE4_9EURO|nr:hypothetical protein GJ744_004457 [Endocarpon pusillum]